MFGGSHATVEQTGQANNAGIEQGGIFMGNDALIQQVGNENTALVEQRAGDGSNESLLKQKGTRNSADVSQRMVTGTNVSLVYQLGTENGARVEQVGKFINTNESEIEIDGAGNNAEVRQGVDMSEDNFNDSRTQIFGNDNGVALRQTGFIGENSSEILIEGTSNVVSVTQRAELSVSGNTAANSSMISIVGNGITSIVTQSTGP